MSIFFDMDGVLAIYSPKDYVGDPMPFEKPNTHYFRERPRDERGVELLRHVAAHTRVNMLSTLSLGAQRSPQLMVEHKLDKRVWLDAVGHDINASFPTLLFARQGGAAKAQVAAAYLRRELKPTDLLIDDFNYNLETWTRAGGTAAKWLNGQNSADSWSGLAIDATSDTFDVETIADNIVREFT